MEGRPLRIRDGVNQAALVAAALALCSLAALMSTREAEIPVAAPMP